MIAVLFEVTPKAQQKQLYLDMASVLKSDLLTIDGFISIERFVSLQNPDKILSLSFWKDEASVKKWRELKKHREAQNTGRSVVFEDYHLRVASVMRDYGMKERAQAPLDSRIIHDQHE